VYVVQSWAEEISVNPDKIEHVLFSTRNEVHRFTDPVLVNILNRVICATGSVKYLGLS
jgi:hypothetical protein